ncbi:MAG TPA: hypothetical protein VGK54_00480 [Chloroflexota bacterium]
MAYLVNEVQRREPPILHAHARFADGQHLHEPTVHVFDTDTGELIWRLPLTELVLLAARFFRLNPGLIVSSGTGDARGQRPDAAVAPDARPLAPGINDLAYLANQLRGQQRAVQQAQAELVSEVEGQEPTVLLVDSATDGVLLGVPLHDLLRLARYLRLDTGLVFQGQG